MKINTIFIISLIVLIGCNNSEKNIYKEYIERFNTEFLIIEHLSDKIITVCQKEMKSPFGAGFKIKPFYLKMIDLKLSSDSIFKMIENIKLSITQKKITSIKETDFTLLEGNYFVSSENINQIKKQIAKLIHFISEIYKNKHYKTFCDSIINRFEKNKWFDLPCLNKKSSKLEIFTVLQKLQLDLKIIEYQVVNYLFAQVDIPDFKFSKIDVVIASNSLQIPVGKEYHADIFLAGFDSTIIPELKINDLKQPIINGKAFYSEKVIGNEKKVVRKGYFQFINPMNMDTVKIPFSFDYEVIE